MRVRITPWEHIAQLLMRMSSSQYAIVVIIVSKAERLFIWLHQFIDMTVLDKIPADRTMDEKYFLHCTHSIKKLAIIAA